MGDEGGFAPNIQDNREGLILLVDAIEKAGYTGKVMQNDALKPYVMTDVPAQSDKKEIKFISLILG